MSAFGQGVVSEFAAMAGDVAGPLIVGVAVIIVIWEIMKGYKR